MIDTSTAYVHTRTSGPVEEVLAPLPAGWTPYELYKAIKEGRVPESDILRSSGHPNTYSLTKCLTEHLLIQYRSLVPLTIVRPSIIGVAIQYPFPGYTDSYGAVGGYAALLGSGYLRVMEADPNGRVDIVPVDMVAQCIIDMSGISDAMREATPPDDASGPSPVRIVNCVAGLSRCWTFHQSNQGMIEHFNAIRDGRRIRWKFAGPRNGAYHWHLHTSQTIPIGVARGAVGLFGRGGKLKLVKFLQRNIKKLNRSLPYYLTNTFDFVSSYPLPTEYVVEDYVRLTVEGVERHLIKRDLWVVEASKENVMHEVVEVE